MTKIDFSKFEIVHRNKIGRNELLRCIDFVRSIEIGLKDITNADQKGKNQKVVIATYTFQGKSFSSNPLFYKNIVFDHRVKDAASIVKHFEAEVFWLDIDVHGWPRSKGETEIESLIIDQITDDPEFKSLLKLLANNQNTGIIQRITLEGKSNQYYRNFENNNHWHDIILLLQQILKNRAVNKKYYAPLVFRWGGNKNTDRERVSLDSNFGSRKFIDCLIENVKNLLITNPLDMKTSYIDLLNYKKQIILQGPPGTGKTRLAKELAKKLIGLQLHFNKPLSITNQQIVDTLKDVESIRTVAGLTDYKIMDVDTEKREIILEKEGGQKVSSSFNKIKESYQNKSYLNKIDDHRTREVSAITNYIAQNITSIAGNFQDSDQFKLIQFHPSYTYEDFVRGISAESSGSSIEYKTVNRILGLFAKEASLNYVDSKKSISRLKEDITFNEKFNSFKTMVVNDLADGNYFNIPNTTAQIIDVDETQFKYTFSANPGYNYSLFFSDFFKLYELGYEFKTSTDITRIESHLTRRSVGTYYFHLYKLIENQAESIAGIEVPALKNYVLIIDEINRANLSSVLGELIYALEYRGDEVESMYSVDGSSRLVLPPNLYIIGTMNTADRSVGHMDYAIRRRFAFVDVLPMNIVDSEIVFHAELFKQVAGLFIKNYDNYVLNTNIQLENEKTYLSEEFDAKDVWLGHSYFIQKKIKGSETLEPKDFNVRVKYEIVPILREYVKDGILNEKAKDIIDIIEKEYPVQ
jgi:5-methylcytosine-specific restriction protein B